MTKAFYPIGGYGDLTPEDAPNNKTFTSDAGGFKTRGTLGTYSNVDIQFTPPTITQVGSSLRLISAFPRPGYYKTGCKYQADSPCAAYGDATTADVETGKTFTSAAGFKKAGTLETFKGAVDPADFQYIRTADTNRGLLVSKNRVKALFYDNAELQCTFPLSQLGNATAADVAAGKTFSGVNGVRETGTATLQTEYTAKGYKQLAASGDSTNSNFVILFGDEIPVPIKTIRLQVVGPAFTNTYASSIELKSSDGKNFSMDGNCSGGNAVTYAGVIIGDNGSLWIRLNGKSVNLVNSDVFVAWSVFSY